MGNSLGILKRQSRERFFSQKGQRVSRITVKVRKRREGTRWQRAIGIYHRRGMKCIPADPAVVFALPKFFDNCGQRYSNDGLLNLIRLEWGNCTGDRYLVQSCQKNTSHETWNDYPETIIGENMLFYSLPGGASFWFLLRWWQVHVLRRSRGGRAEALIRWDENDTNLAKLWEGGRSK